MDAYLTKYFNDKKVISSIKSALSKSNIPTLKFDFSEVIKASPSKKKKQAKQQEEEESNSDSDLTSSQASQVAKKVTYPGHKSNYEEHVLVIFKNKLFIK